jgi:hypothetical protein
MPFITQGNWNSCLPQAGGKITLKNGWLEKGISFDEDILKRD